MDELVENFRFFDHWEERYQYLIDLGRKLPPMDDVLKTEGSRVQGCISQVWLVATDAPDGSMRFLADSDAAIVKGLIALVMAAYDGCAPSEIMETDIMDVFARIGFEQHLSPNRRNGFVSMVGRIKSLAANRI